MICDSLLKDDRLSDESLKAKIEALQRRSVRISPFVLMNILKSSGSFSVWVAPRSVNLNEKNITAQDRGEAIAVRDSGLNRSI